MRETIELCFIEAISNDFKNLIINEVCIADKELKEDIPSVSFMSSYSFNKGDYSFNEELSREARSFLKDLKVLYKQSGWEFQSMYFESTIYIMIHSVGKFIQIDHIRHSNNPLCPITLDQGYNQHG